MTTFNIGDEVIFGRLNGEQTRGRVVKVNAKSIGVEQMEARGQSRVRTAGAKWRVARSLVRHANGAAPAVVSVASTTTFRVGDRVSWDHGSRTLTGTVVRVNRKTISTHADGAPASRYWRISPRLLRAASGAAPAPKAKRLDALIIQDLIRIEGSLSPENLHWDGERSASQARAAERRLLSQQRALHAELGRQPAHTELWGR